MTMKALEVSKRLAMQAQHEMNPAYCEDNSPQFVDDQCARMAFYSARRNLIFRPNYILKTALDNAQSFTARLIHNLKKIGVQFSEQKPFFYKVAHGHISLKVDGVISGGFPDFPNEQAILLTQTMSGVEFAELCKSQMPYSGYLVNHAQLLMAYSGIKKTAIFIIARNSGEVFAQVVELNYNLATNIDNASKFGVTSQYAPDRIIPVHTFTTGKHENAKCNSCYFAVHCMLPDSPPPICRNCEHCVFADNGFVGCSAQADRDGNPFPLNDEMQQNLHACTHHIYRPDILDSWAGFQGEAEKTVIGESGPIQAKIGNIYANKITGQVFYNIPSVAGAEDGYTSYEIFGAKGKELVGDKAIDSLKKIFNASISGIENNVSGSDLPD